MGPFTEVVIGANDVAAAVAFFELFGFAPVGEMVIDEAESAALFGLAGPAGATRLAATLRPGSATLLIVSTPLAGSAPTGWSTGPRALDVYTRDLDATMSIARDAGFLISPVGGLSAGPMTMRQAMVHGPGALSVVFVETSHRRSSVLDTHPVASHSEPHSVVWVVSDHAAEVAWWTTGGWTTEGMWDEGLTAGPTISFSEPSISDELDLAERPTPITMTMLSDTAVGPIRLELMTFDDHQSPTPAPIPHLEPGLFAMTVGGAGGTAARLVTSPRGVRVVLRP